MKILLDLRFTPICLFQSEMFERCEVTLEIGQRPVMRDFCSSVRRSGLGSPLVEEVSSSKMAWIRFYFDWDYFLQSLFFCSLAINLNNKHIQNTVRFYCLVNLGEKACNTFLLFSFDLTFVMFLLLLLLMIIRLFCLILPWSTSFLLFHFFLTNFRVLWLFLT